MRKWSKRRMTGKEFLHEVTKNKLEQNYYNEAKNRKAKPIDYIDYANLKHMSTYNKLDKMLIPNSYDPSLPKGHMLA